MNIFGLRIEFKNLMAETDRSQCASSQFTIWTPGHQFGPVRDIAQTPRPLTIIAPANPTGLGLLNRPLQHSRLGDLGSCAIKNRVKKNWSAMFDLCMFVLFSFVLDSKKNPTKFSQPQVGWVPPHRWPNLKMPGKKTPVLKRTRAVLVRWDVGVPLWPPTPRLRVMPVPPEGGVNGHGAFQTKSNGGKWHGHLHGNNETSVYSMVIPGDSKQLKL